VSANRHDGCSLDGIVRAQPTVAIWQGVTCVAYGPLGHGKEGLLTHPEIEKVAEEVGKTPAQVRA